LLLLPHVLYLLVRWQFLQLVLLDELQSLFFAQAEHILHPVLFQGVGVLLPDPWLQLQHWYLAQYHCGLFGELQFLQ